jgi:hypothetical protein
MLDHFLQSFLLKSKQTKDGYLNKMTQGGGIRDFMEYKYVLGLYKGLQEADDIIRNLYRSSVEGIERSNMERAYYGEEESESD